MFDGNSQEFIKLSIHENLLRGRYRDSFGSELTVADEIEFPLGSTVIWCE